MESRTSEYAPIFPSRSVTSGPGRCEGGPSAFPASPDETPLTGAPLVESLPPPNTKRWVVRRKAAVLAAVRGGGITIEEACRAYQLSKEELLSWERAFEIHGLAGLRTTRVQQYRRTRDARIPFGVVDPAS